MSTWWLFDVALPQSVDKGSPRNHTFSFVGVSDIESVSNSIALETQKNSLEVMSLLLFFSWIYCIS